METSFLWFGVFSGSFGVRSIVLCKWSGRELYWIDRFKARADFWRPKGLTIDRQCMRQATMIMFLMYVLNNQFYKSRAIRQKIVVFGHLEAVLNGLIYL